jgi:hypothetical protein
MNQSLFYRKKTLCGLLSAALLFPCLLRAENAVGADFLLVEPHARAAAMSNAFVGVADDCNALVFNPAGLTVLGGSSLSFTHYASFADTNYENIMYASNKGNYGFGFRTLYDTTSNFANIDKTGQNNGNVSNYDMLAQASFGIAFLPGFSAGASLKYFRSVLMVYSKEGFAADMGALLMVSKMPEVYLGLALTNLGAQGAFENSADPLPTKLTAGIGYKWRINGDIKMIADADVDRVMLNKYMPDIQAGAEFCFYNRLFLSAGFGATENGDGMTFGAGIEPLDSLKIFYAFQPFNDLGETSRISMDLFF